MTHFLSKYTLTYGDSNEVLWAVAAAVFIILAIIICVLILCNVLDILPCWVIGVVTLIMTLACSKNFEIGVNKANEKNIKAAITSKYTDAIFINAETDEGQFIHDNKLCKYTVKDIPTTYDADRVVNQLEEHFNATENKDMRLAYHHAIEIVKAGGIDG